MLVISGKINYFNGKYQITNPDYVVPEKEEEYITKNIPKYKLTKGLNEKKYRSISEQITKNIPPVKDWLEDNFLKKNNLNDWNIAIKNLHHSEEGRNSESKSFRRLVFDEISANFLTLSQNRMRIKKNKVNKVFNEKISNEIKKKLSFRLTDEQTKVLEEIKFQLGPLAHIGNHSLLHLKY